MIDLISPVYTAAEKRRRLYPQHTNRASSLGGLCFRELVYERTAWDKAALPDVDLQLIFEEGELHEKAVLRLLQDAGFTVIEQQISLSWPEYQITGHMDATVVVLPRVLPLDVKSMSPHIWDSIFKRGHGVYEWSEVAEVFNAKPWTAKYRGQLTLYCLLRECDEGILLCKNKTSGALAQVNIPLDYTYGEQLIQRVQAINRHVAEGTLPERIKFDDGICPSCRFYAECLPDHVGRDPLIFLEDQAIEDLLAEREIHEEAADFYDAADKRFKAWAKARPEERIALKHWFVEKEVRGGKTFVKATRI
jgi:CRISPR/Cas system-associated exonuclease Cas4 (RecB family)